MKNWEMYHAFFLLRDPTNYPILQGTKIGIHVLWGAVGDGPWGDMEKWADKK